MRCPHCREVLTEVNRDEYVEAIQVIYECEACARTVLAEFAFMGYYDEEDNPIEEELK